jgi:hypothetical protein
MHPVESTFFCCQECVFARYLAIEICEPDRKLLMWHWFYFCVRIFRVLTRNGSTCYIMNIVIISTALVLALSNCIGIHCSCVTVHDLFSFNFFFSLSWVPVIDSSCEWVGDRTYFLHHHVQIYSEDCTVSYCMSRHHDLYQRYNCGLHLYISKASF